MNTIELEDKKNCYNENNEISLLTNFQEKVGEWASFVFPLSSNNSRIKHLQEEIEELKNDPTDPFEAADIMLLLLHHAYANDYDLLTVARKKFDIIKNRKWGEPNSDGVVHHIK